MRRDPASRRGPAQSKQLVDAGLALRKASGRKTPRSDVDLLIVGDVTLAELIPALRTAEARLGREVNPTVIRSGNSGTS